MANQGHNAELPSDGSSQLPFFDRFATAATTFVSRAWFFAICVLLILVWAPSIFVIANVDTWQLIINTATTIVTFLLVALLQNSQTRADAALQQKLNALADGLADLMAHVDRVSPVENGEDSDERRLQRDIRELRTAVGLERRETS